ncbi:MAG: hypothetical protein GY855_09995 [candidate division Zixibacteria bacterium]|nr:hypothetical protein [candidate division Zixibacteria bacterium]
MKDTAPEYFRLEVSNSKRCIAIADDMLKSLLKLTPLTENDRYRFRVAVSEIVSNGYLHGNEANPEKKITISCSIFTDKIIIIVEDEGNGFIIDKVEEKYSIHGIYATGGRGLKIADKFADDIQFKKTDEEHFSVIATKCFPVIENFQRSLHSQNFCD